jgi:hypothetical protein
MPKIEEHVGVRSLGSTRIDVDITVDSPDGEEALEWVEDLQQAVKATVDEKTENR